MKKVTVFLTLMLLVFSSEQLFSQETDLPNLTPPSPDVFALTKYGDHEINESTGAVNLQIPLHTYQAGQLSLPISMNYSGTGVKVNDLASWTGINWTLQAGGVISRTIKDDPDEYATNRLDYTTSEYQNLDLTDGSTDANLLNGALSFNSGDYDTESDIFSFSFPGGSGSFFLDENFEPVLLKKDKELKVEIPLNGQPDARTSLYVNKQFVITTPDGVQYYFGGQDVNNLDATEDSNTFLAVGGEDNPTATTAFYLTKIEHPINGTIYFEYIEITTDHIYTLYKEQSLYKKSGTFITPCGQGPQLEQNGITTSTVNNKIYDPRFLSKIRSLDNTIEINFISSSINNPQLKRQLNTIEIKNGINDLNKIDFTYLSGYDNSIVDISVTPRFFLEKIEFNKDKDNSATPLGQEFQEYNFEYDNAIGLPNRFDTGQDHLGYYNGKSTVNASLVPNNIRSNPYNVSNHGLADRSPDFNYSKKGTLTKVYYPTGGYTEFEYEAPPVKEKEYENIYLNAWRNISNRIPTTSLHDGVPQVLSGGGILFNDPIVENQDVVITVTLVVEENDASDVNPQDENVNLKITNLTNSSVQVITHTVSLAADTFYKTKDYTVSLLAGNRYKIEIDIDPAQGATAIPMEVHTNFEYFKGYNEVDGNGLRVKGQKDYTSSTNSTNMKRYYYHKINDFPTIDDLDFIQTPNYSTYYYYTECCSNPVVGSYTYKPYFKISSKLDAGFYGDTNGLPVYNYVSVSYGGDNFEKGGRQSFYLKSGNIAAVQLSTYSSGLRDLSQTQMYNDFSPATSFPQARGNYAVFNGTLLEQNLYQTANSVISKIETSKYTYDNSSYEVRSNLVGKKIYNKCEGEIDKSMSNFGLGLYENFGYKHQITHSENTKYIDPVPITETDESAYRKVTTTEDYTYGALVGLPTTIKRNSSTSEVLKTTNYYPIATDVSSLNGLSTTEINAYTALENANRIASPIHVESFREEAGLSTKLQTSRTIYADNLGKVLPSTIQTAKGGNSLEDRVVFSEYDTSNGNLLKVHYKDGSVTQYQYNGLSQVTRKIENYKPAVTSELPPEEDTTDINLCQSIQDAYPDSQVTYYNYDPVTNLLTSIRDPRCNVITYHYDSLYRLQYVKDQDGNILNENEYRYTNQN